MVDAPVDPGLETAIGLAGNGPAKDALVRERLSQADVFALGHYDDDMQIKDILYYTAPNADGSSVDIVPVFTRLDFLNQAVSENPEWVDSAVLRVNGGELLDSIDMDLAINPWSEVEYRLPKTPRLQYA